MVRHLKAKRRTTEQTACKNDMEKGDNDPKIQKMED